MKDAELSSLPLGSVDSDRVTKFESTPWIYPFYLLTFIHCWIYEAVWWLYVSILTSHTVSPTIVSTGQYQVFKFMVRIETMKYWLPQEELFLKLLNLQHDP